MRDYQVDAQVAFLKYGRGVLECATGSGKTEMIIALTKALKCKTLVVVRGLDLMFQSQRRFSTRLKQKVGVLGAGRTRET